MTTVSQAIIDAFRQSNLLAIGDDPTDEQIAEGVRYLNRIIKSVFGNEAGDNLEELALGRGNISRPVGFPWYGNSPPGSYWFVPENQRLMCNIDEPVTVFLHPTPDDGARVGVVDTSSNFATNNFTLSGNGRTIDGSDFVTLTANGTADEWVYRSDVGGWKKITNLAEGDDLPFPLEFDDFFITMLAMRFNPSYGQQMDAQSLLTLKRARTQFQARYQSHRPTQPELALLKMPDMGFGYDRRRGGYYGIYGTPTDSFNAGYPL